MKHAIGADVLIDVRPVHAVSISNQRPIGSLLRFGVGEAHDQASGTLMTRPSIKWAVIVSSVTST